MQCIVIVSFSDIQSNGDLLNQHVLLLVFLESPGFHLDLLQ